jgi:hypothetical protein
MPCRTHAISAGYRVSPSSRGRRTDVGHQHVVCHSGALLRALSLIVRARSHTRRRAVLVGSSEARNSRR